MTQAASIPTPKTSSIANWFGSNRTLASTVGVQLGKCEWVGVPFCGGCCELRFIKSRSGIASDLHRDLINLARVIRQPELNAQLIKRLECTPFHTDELEAAQARCLDRVANAVSGLFGNEFRAVETDSVAWAYDYFLSTWMTAGGRSGQKGEFNQGMSYRWNANGGDSCRRFRSAAESLGDWCKIFQPWNFICLDAFDFLDKCQDHRGHGIYCDAPWPDDGDGYKHLFNELSQRRLAKTLNGITRARVVIRFGDHPLIRELYPETKWNWIRQTSRAQTNGAVQEVLILNGPSYAKGESL